MRSVKLFVAIAMLFVACKKDTNSLINRLPSPDSISLPVTISYYEAAALEHDTVTSLIKPRTTLSILYNEAKQIIRVAHASQLADDTMGFAFRYNTDGTLATMKYRSTAESSNADYNLYYNGLSVDGRPLIDSIAVIANFGKSHWLTFNYDTDGKLAGYKGYRLVFPSDVERYEYFECTVERKAGGDSLRRLYHGQDRDIEEVYFSPALQKQEKGYDNQALLLVFADLHRGLLYEILHNNVCLYQLVSPKDNYMFRNYLDQAGKQVYYTTVQRNEYGVIDSAKHIRNRATEDLELISGIKLDNQTFGK